MERTFSVISVICFVLAAACLVVSIILARIYHIKNVYLELKCGPEKPRFLGRKKEENEPITKRI